MADKNYLGLGVIFKGIDKGLTKTAKDVQYNLLRTDKQIKNVQDSIDNFDFKPVKDFFKQDTSKFTKGMDKAIQSKWSEFKDLSNIFETKEIPDYFANVDTSSLDKVQKSIDGIKFELPLTKAEKFQKDASESLFKYRGSLDMTDQKASMFFDNYKKYNKFIGYNADRYTDLLASLKAYGSGLDGINLVEFTQGMSALDDSFVKYTIDAKKAANIKELIDSLETMRKAGAVTEKQFEALKKSIIEAAGTEVPKPDTEALQTLSDLMNKQGLKGWDRLLPGYAKFDKANRKLRNEIDKANKSFEYQKKSKAIETYRIELEKLRRQGKLTEQEFQVISARLKVLGDDFIKQAKNPSLFYDKLKSGIKKFGDVASSIISGMPNIAEGLIGKGQVSQLGGELDYLNTKMSLVMNPAQSGKFLGTLEGVLRTTGMTVDQTGALTEGMNRFGVSVDNSSKLLPFMGNLVGKMALDAGQVAEMTGQLDRTLNMSSEAAQGLVEDFYEMGRAKGFVNFLEDMPEIVKETMVSFKRLGITNADVASKSIKSTAALTGMYRSLNIEQKAAVAASLKMQQSLTSMSMDIKRIGVGLDPENFEGMIDIAGEITRLSGKSADEAFQMIQNGAKDTEGFMKQMMEIANLPSTTEKDVVRLGEIVRKQFGDESANIIMNADLRKKALAEIEAGHALQEANAKALTNELGKQKLSQEDYNKLQALSLNNDAKGIEAKEKLAKIDLKAGIKKPEKSLAKAEDKMGGTLKVTQELLATNKALTTAMAELAGKYAIIKSWTAQIREWQSLQSDIQKQNLVGTAITLAKAIDAGGLAAAAYFAGADSMGNSLAKFGVKLDATTDALRSVAALTSALQTFTNILSGLGIGTALKALSGLIPSLSGLASGTIGLTIGGVAAAAIGTAIAGAVSFSLGKTIMDPDSGITKWMHSNIPGLLTVDQTIESGVNKAINYAGDTWGNLFNKTPQVSNSAITKPTTKTPSSVVPKKEDLIDVLGKKMTMEQLKLEQGLANAKVAQGAAQRPLVSPDAATYVKNIDEAAKKVKEAQLKLDEYKNKPKPLMNTIQTPAPATMQAPKPITMTNQPGAPTLASMPISTPAVINKTKGNTLDDVVRTLVDMQNNFVEQIKNINQNPVVVTLQGDAQKFMKIVNNVPSSHANLVTSPG